MNLADTKKETLERNTIEHLVIWAYPDQDYFFNKNQLEECRVFVDKIAVMEHTAFVVVPYFPKPFSEEIELEIERGFHGPPQGYRQFIKDLDDLMERSYQILGPRFLNGGFPDARAAKSLKDLTDRFNVTPRVFNGKPQEEQRLFISINCYGKDPETHMPANPKKYNLQEIAWHLDWSAASGPTRHYKEKKLIL